MKFVGEPRRVSINQFSNSGKAPDHQEQYIDRQQRPGPSEHAIANSHHALCARVGSPSRCRQSPLPDLRRRPILWKWGGRWFSLHHVPMIVDLVAHGVELFCYGLGRTLVPIFSLGQLRCDPMDRDLWGVGSGYIYRKEGRMWVSFDGTVLAGFITGIIGMLVVARVCWLHGFFD